MTNFSLHARTPLIAVVDPRTLPLRTITYLRHDPTVAALPLVHRLSHDERGLERARWDPRLWDAAVADDGSPPTLKTITALSGAVLRSESVDAGWRTILPAASGLTTLAWDARGNVRRLRFDDLGRPVTVHERQADGTDHCLERFTYGRGDEGLDPTNRGGRLLRHDDPAGTVHCDAVDLGGGLAGMTRRFLLSVAPPDWPDDPTARNALLEASHWSTGARFDATGAVLESTDARDNRWRFRYGVTGQIHDAWLQLAGLDASHVFGDAVYDARGSLVSRGTANGGLSTTWAYGADDGRLRASRSWRTGDGRILHAATYAHDPAGNILETRRPGNTDTYTYDSLNRLVAAEGTESAQASPGPELPPWQPYPMTGTVDYTERYTYDSAGNLLSLDHQGAWNLRRSMRVSATSNRSIPWTEDDTDVEAAFDANGHQCVLPGLCLAWNARGQLADTVNDACDGEASIEHYVYDGAGLRVRKRCGTTAFPGGREVRYLPGMEWHTDLATGQDRCVVNSSIGDLTVRCIRWSGTPPDGLANDAIRFQLCDHLGSHTLEVDEGAQPISDEWYRPYGETAGRAARDPAEAGYKRHRYSGKERDDTGLYYYGYRYYAPALQRWASPDPGGYVDGWNLYTMVRGNPATFSDAMGLWSSTDTKVVVASALRGLAVELTTTATSRALQWALGDPDEEDTGPGTPYLALGMAAASGVVVAGATAQRLAAPYSERTRRTMIGVASTIAGAMTGAYYHHFGVTDRQMLRSVAKMAFKSLVGPVMKGLGPRNKWKADDGPPSYEAYRILPGAIAGHVLATARGSLPKSATVPIRLMEKAFRKGLATFIQLNYFRADVKTQDGFAFKKPDLTKLVTAIPARIVLNPLKAPLQALSRFGMTGVGAAITDEASSSVFRQTRKTVTNEMKQSLATVRPHVRASDAHQE